jgi:hypothetical protein
VIKFPKTNLRYRIAFPRMVACICVTAVCALTGSYAAAEFEADVAGQLNTPGSSEDVCTSQGAANKCGPKGGKSCKTVEHDSPDKTHRVECDAQKNCIAVAQCLTGLKNGTCKDRWAALGGSPTLCRPRAQE